MHAEGACELAAVLAGPATAVRMDFPGPGRGSAPGCWTRRICGEDARGSTENGCKHGSAGGEVPVGRTARNHCPRLGGHGRVNLSRNPVSMVLVRRRVLRGARCLPTSYRAQYQGEEGPPTGAQCRRAQPCGTRQVARHADRGVSRRTHSSRGPAGTATSCMTCSRCRPAPRYDRAGLWVGVVGCPAGRRLLDGRQRRLVVG